MSKEYNFRQSIIQHVQSWLDKIHKDYKLDEATITITIKTDCGQYKFDMDKDLNCGE